MNDWDFSPPARSTLGDHEVRLSGNHLCGKSVALLISGGIAAIRAPSIARELRKQGATVTAFCSEEALRYTTEDALTWSTNQPVVTRLTPSAEHLSDTKNFDGYLIAPATYNTINKIAHGIGDGVLTATMAAALGRMTRHETRILIAPTMHGDMHNFILTESLNKLHKMGVRIIPPRDDYGKHNIPETEILVAEVCAALSKSKLQGKRILVTGGPTPVPIDNVRTINNIFTGALGTAIATELTLRGAKIQFVLGKTGLTPPSYIEYIQINNFNEYRDAVISTLERKDYIAGIYSAAVADYQPCEVAPGKIPSDGTLKNLQLIPTEKIIGLVLEKFPNIPIISFKYQENVSHEELISIARARLEKGHLAVIANRGEEKGPSGEQVAYVVSAEREPAKFVSKGQIASGIADFLEQAIPIS